MSYQADIICQDIIYHFAGITKIDIDEKDSITIYYHKFKVKKFKPGEYWDYKIKEV